MEFEMKHKLRTGDEIIVLVEAVDDECILSYTTPPSFGVHLNRMLEWLAIESEAIQEKAWESYRQRLKERRDHFR